MFAKIKSSVFIDALHFEFTSLRENFFKAVLKDDSGSVCSVLEKGQIKDKGLFTWTGLNDLPYGKYTLELFNGESEMKLNLVKRV